MPAVAVIPEFPTVADAHPHENVADAELLRQFAATRDTALLGELFSRHADSAYRIAQNLLRNSSDAEDAVQTAFLHALSSRTAFQQTEDESVKAWLFKNVVNACKMRIREESARRRRETVAGSVRVTVTESNVDSELAARAVHAARTLPENVRLPVWMHYLEGLSHKEVAAALAIPEATVRSQASRGIEQLRQILAGHDATLAKLTSASLAVALVSAPLPAAPATLTAALHTLAASAAAGAGAAAVSAKATAATKGAAAVKVGLTAKVLVAVTVTALAAGAVVVAPKWIKPATPAIATAVNGDAGETGGEKTVKSAATPAASKITGWRGDWTGRYPDAAAPLEWSIRGKNLLTDLRCSAKPAKNDADGSAIPDGCIREWLVAGPFPCPNPNTLAEPVLPNEAALQPVEGDKAGSVTWTVNSDSAGVDFGKLYDKKPNQAAYAFSYIYSKSGGACVSWVRHSHFMQMWVNGKIVYNTADGSVRSLTGGYPRAMGFTLDKGWNRLLVKVTLADEPHWGFAARIYAAPGYANDLKNVAWLQRLPNMSTSSPLLVGDKIYVMSEPSDLICCNKADGKVLWIRSNSQFDALTPEELAATPALKPIEALAAKLKQVDDELVPLLNSGDAQLGAKLGQKNELEQQIIAQLHNVDGKKFSLIRQDGGFTDATPCSDGQTIIAWVFNGVLSAFDASGNRKWCARVVENGVNEHGYGASPTIVDGKVIVLFKDYNAYDLQTGKSVWKAELQRGRHATYGSIVATQIGAETAIISPIGSAIRASDGKPLWNFTANFDGECTTSVVDKGVWYNYDRAGVYAIKLPDTLAGSAAIVKHVACGNYAISSPLFVDGLLYCVDINGLLNVVDPAAGSVVYTQKLPLQPGNGMAGAGVSSSPTLIGKNIYVFDECGNAVVFAPGRAYKQLAVNKMEIYDYSGGDSEARQAMLTPGNPAVDASALYIRGNSQLICIAADNAHSSSTSNLN